MPACNATSSSTAALAFDGVSYNQVPQVLALNNIPSCADGNDTLLVVNRVGGSLVTSAATINGLFGILYDDAENPFSLSLAAASCQLRVTLNNNIRVTPRIETLIPAGRSGWMKLWGASEVGLFGAMLTRNTSANNNAFNSGHNLHKLTLTTMTYTIPVFPPSC